MIPMYNTKTFVEIFDDYGTFKYHYINSGIPQTIGCDDSTSTSNLQTLYYLLYAKFGNSPIANMDENQFIYKVLSTIFMYGPAWEKRLDIQDKLRALDLENLREGTLAIYNSALNPENAPSTTTKTELDYINSQNTTRYIKSKTDAYATLWSLITTDVTADFLEKFRPLFQIVVRPSRIYLYEDEEDE